MPTYHFNVHDGHSHPDGEGHELPSLEAAKREAIKLAGQLIGEIGDMFWDGQEWVMEVTNDRGLILFSLTFFGSHSAAITRRLS